MIDTDGVYDKCCHFVIETKVRGGILVTCGDCYNTVFAKDELEAMVKWNGERRNE